MAIGKEIKVVLSLDKDGFSVGIRDANGQLKTFAKQVEQTASSVKVVENSMTSMGAKAHRLVMTMGMARFALMDLKDIFLSLPLAVLKTSGEIERLQKLMEGLSKETDATRKKLEAASNVKFLFGMAKNAPFEVKALGDAFVKFKTGGLDPTNGSLQALVDGVARFGGSSESLKRASIAIQQMAGKGVVSMEELRQQLGEAVPTAMQAMAEGMGLSMQELSKKVATGTVAANSAISKMLAVMTVQNAGAAAAMMDTWVGLLERLKTQWELFKLEMGSEGMFDGAKQALEELIQSFGGAGSLARSVGGTMNDAMVSVINLSKKLVELSEYIKIAGQAWGTYWVASKIAPLIARTTQGVTNAASNLQMSKDWTLAQLEAEKRSKQAMISANADFLANRIRANEAEIAAEQRKALAMRELQRQQLRDQVASNAATIAAQEQRISEAIAAERALMASPIAKTYTVAGLQTQAQRDEFAALQKRLDKTRETATAAKEHIRILQLENDALTRQSAALGRTAVDLTAVSQARIAENNHLQKSVEKYRDLAKGVSTTNESMAMLRAAGASVIGFLKSMIFSMNGLIMVIMAAVYAWDYFSEKAQKAAKDAAIALDAKARLERGGATEETLKSSETNLANQKDRKANLDESIALLEGKRVTTPQTKARLDKLIEERKKLVADIANAEKLVTAERVQLMDKQSTEAARDIAAMADQAGTRAIKAEEQAQQKINEKYVALAKSNKDGKLTKAQEQAKGAELVQYNVSALDKQKAALTAEARKYTELAAAAAAGSVERQKYEKAVELINKSVGNVNTQIAALQAPNEEFTKEKKPKKPSVNLPTDDLLGKIRQDERKVLESRQALETLNKEVIDMAALQKQADDQIDQIVEQDRRRQTVHTPEDVSRAKKLRAEAMLLEEAARMQGSVIPKLEGQKEKLRQLNDQVTTGKFKDNNNDEEAKTLQSLERLRAKYPEMSVAIQGVIDKQRELVDVSKQIDVASGIIDNEKRLRESRVSVIVNERERIKAQGEQEVRDIEAKYEQLLAKTAQYSTEYNRLTAQRTEELQLQAEKQANALRTPIQKLVTDWGNGVQQLEDATGKWAGGFLSTLTDVFTTGTADWRKFLASMLTDMLDMKLKQTLGQQLLGAFDGVGTKVGQLLGLNRATGGAAGAVGTAGQAVAGAAGQAVAGGATSAASSAAASAAATSAAQAAANTALTTTTKAASDAMVNVSTQGLAQMASSTLTSAVMATTGATADQVAMTATALLTENTIMASLALAQFAVALQTSASISVSTAAFADGGIMTSQGALPLHKYAKGGVANTPQVAIFGEGSMNEAYVPLPDGRSIPVTMRTDGQGAAPAGAGGQNVVISITVNEASGQEQSSESGGDATDWRRMAERVKAVVREELVVQQRPGGSLYK